MICCWLGEELLCCAIYFLVRTNIYLVFTVYLIARISTLEDSEDEYEPIIKTEFDMFIEKHFAHPVLWKLSIWIVILIKSILEIAADVVIITIRSKIGDKYSYWWLYFRAASAIFTLLWFIYLIETYPYDQIFESILDDTLFVDWLALACHSYCFCFYIAKKQRNMELQEVHTDKKVAPLPNYVKDADQNPDIGGHETKRNSAQGQETKRNSAQGQETKRNSAQGQETNEYSGQGQETNEYSRQRQETNQYSEHGQDVNSWIKYVYQSQP